MRVKHVSCAGIIIAAVSIFVSCERTNNNVTPSHVTLDASGTMLDNVSNLGRVLFYDTHLSINNSIACASCHKQTYAFSDNVALSPGFENKVGTRNAFTIQNLASFSILFWDGRDSSLGSMVLMPILNHVEMGMSDVSGVVSRVASEPYYADLFTKAYGSGGVTANGIANALSYFVMNITSFNSPFDNFLNNKTSLTPIETYGKDLFFSKYNCNSCHQVDVRNAYTITAEFANVGLDLVYADNGLGNVTHNPSDNGKFKVPNLRNVALTAPYTHDGRFATLGDVIDHYSHGIANNVNLDARLRAADGKPLQMNISDDEKTAIIAFLNSMTDYSVVTNPNLASPFK